MSEDYDKKYLKYKEKYLALKKELASLKNMKGGVYPPALASGDAGDDDLALRPGAGSDVNLEYLNQLPDFVVEETLQFLSLKDIISIGATIKRFNAICNNYIGRYIRNNKYRNNPEDVLLLFNHPVYGAQIRTYFSNLDLPTKMRVSGLLQRRVQEFQRIFMTAVRQNGGTSSPRDLFENGGRLYKIEFIYDLQPGHTIVETLISANFHTSMAGPRYDTRGFFMVKYDNNGSVIDTYPSRDIYSMFVGSLGSRLAQKFERGESNLNVRVVECTYDPHTFGTEHPPRQTRYLAVLL
jgi:hypothetical protein